VQRRRRDQASGAGVFEPLLGKTFKIAQDFVGVEEGNSAIG
jgi:hypothetical protein